MQTTVNYDLSPLNTLALPGKAAQFVRITDTRQLTNTAWSKYPRFILGGGSNLVLTGDVDRLVLQMAIPGRRLLTEDSDAFYVEAGAGENWHAFVQWTLAQGWPGLENLSLIPGTVGAAPIQNIGAYGLEAGDFLHSVTAWDFRNRAFFQVDRSGCRFGYRDSLFKQESWHLNGQVAITAVIFRLPRQWQPNLRYTDVNEELAARGIVRPNAHQIAEAVIAVRQRKLPDPAELPNAGSFFHNPVVDASAVDTLRASYPTLPCYPQPDGRIKLAAGWLIEQAGWKGKNLGPVGMYEKQALVLVNRGGATGNDVRCTMAAVQADVRAKFGVELTPEPIFL